MPDESDISTFETPLRLGCFQSTSISLPSSTFLNLYDPACTDLLNPNRLDTYIPGQEYQILPPDLSVDVDTYCGESIFDFLEAGLRDETEESRPSDSLFTDSQDRISLPSDVWSFSIFVNDGSGFDFLSEYSSQLLVDTYPNIPEAMKNEPNKRFFSSCHSGVSDNKCKQNSSPRTGDGKLSTSTELEKIIDAQPNQCKSFQSLDTQGIAGTLVKTLRVDIKETEIAKK